MWRNDENELSSIDKQFDSCSLLLFEKSPPPPPVVTSSYSFSQSAERGGRFSNIKVTCLPVITTKTSLLTYYYEAFKGSSKMDLLRLSLSPAGTIYNHPAPKSVVSPPKSPSCDCDVSWTCKGNSSSVYLLQLLMPPPPGRTEWMTHDLALLTRNDYFFSMNITMRQSDCSCNIMIGNSYTYDELQYLCRGKCT